MIDKAPEGYEWTARLTFELVKACKPPPRFALPPREIALIASLADVGHKLARDTKAHHLVETLISVSVLTGHDAPTAMMLRVILDQLEIPTDVLNLADIGAVVAST